MGDYAGFIVGWSDWLSSCGALAAAAIVDKYLLDADYDAILADAGLAAAGIADDEVPAGDVIVARSPLEEEYRRLCGIGAGASERGARFGRLRQASRVDAKQRIERFDLDVLPQL